MKQSETTIKKFLERDVNNIERNKIKHQLYTSRDLSWLDFNRRVLYLAMSKEVPFLERLKFLAISASNLDEFIRVRLTALYKDSKLEGEQIGISGITFEEEFCKVLEEIKSFRDLQNKVCYKLVDSLKKKNVKIEQVKNLVGEMRKSARMTFINTILPSLTPISYESTKETPFFKSGELALVVEASNFKHSKTVFTFIPISKVFDRFICIDKKTNTYVLIEDLIMTYIKLLFNKKQIHYCGLFRVLREGDIDLSADREIPLVERVVEFCYRREKADPIFVEVQHNIPKNVLKVLKEVLGVKNKFIHKTKLMDLRMFFEPIINSEEVYAPFSPQHPKELIGESSIMEAMEEEDILLYHPYDSYDSVIKLIQEAARDPRVLVIRNTLYRVSSENSPIVNALCEAARNGKQVSVLLELKARFDEEQNISLIDKMTKAGVQITYGLENYKTHCKMLSIVKRTKDGLGFYTHIGTGNYNDKTAKLYSDASYFTCNRKIGEDVINIFNFVAGYTTPNPIRSKRVFYSPKSLRKRIEDLIDIEINNVKKGGEGRVILKMNSISDKRMIDKIYRASSLGVKFDIIVRGICSIKPINKNITIKSIVGRYLEHARIYYFFNGGKSKVYISSADMLTRNLDKRVELLVEIDRGMPKRKILNILRLNVLDTDNSYALTPKGKWLVADNIDKKDRVNMFNELIKMSLNDLSLPKTKKKIWV